MTYKIVSDILKFYGRERGWLHLKRFISPVPLKEVCGSDGTELSQAPLTDSKELGQELEALEVCPMDQLLVRSHHLTV